MMKRLMLCLIVVVSIAGCDNTDVRLAAEAGIDALKAVTLSDEDVALLAKEASRDSDGSHVIAGPGDPYARRLSRLIGDYHEADGYRFSYRVYLSPQVNAFAMADGSIRIYSGLMDMLDDGELLFVVGHEMGHVVQKHIRKKIMLAYAGSAIRKGIASQNNLAGEIARSGLGGIAQALFNAQFSQQEEREADDYGIVFLKNEGLDIQAAVSALDKLATLGSSHSFLSSHPAPAARSARLQNQVENPGTIGKPSLFQRIVDTIIGWFA